MGWVEHRPFVFKMIDILSFTMMDFAFKMMDFCLETGGWSRARWSQSWSGTHFCR